MFCSGESRCGINTWLPWWVLGLTTETPTTDLSLILNMPFASGDSLLDFFYLSTQECQTLASKSQVSAKNLNSKLSLYAVYLQIPCHCCKLFSYLFPRSNQNQSPENSRFYVGCFSLICHWPLICLICHWPQLASSFCVRCNLYPSRNCMGEPSLT